MLIQALGSHIARPSGPFATRIEADRLQMLYRSLPIALLTSVINAMVLALIQYPLIPAPVVASWAAAVALLTLWRIVGYVRFLRHPPPLAAVPAWKRRFIAEVLLSGILWGSAAILLYP